MKYACILVCVLLYCTNVLAQEQKKHRKTARNTERPLPKPQFAEPNTTSSPAMTSAIAPNIQAKALSTADSIAIANRFWSANDSLNLRLSQPIPMQAMESAVDSAFACTTALKSFVGQPFALGLRLGRPLSHVPYSHTIWHWRFVNLPFQCTSQRNTVRQLL